MLKGKKILVAGGGGFLGSAIIRRLLREGAHVRATLHNKRPKLEAPEVEWIHADLMDPAACARVAESMDMVFMCAANTQGAGVIATTPLAHVTPNVVMNTYMLDAAYAAGVKRFVFFGSGAAYPDTGDRPVREDEMFMGDPSPVYHAVAWMKRYAEILCDTYANRIKNPMPCVVIRPSNVYGPLDKYDPKTSHVTAALIRRVVERQTPFVVWGDGGDVRDLIYVDDFVDGVMAAVQVEDPYLAVNICSGTAVTVREVVETLVKVDRFDDIDLRFDTSKPSTVRVRLIDHSFAQKKLGFECKVGLAEGLRRTLEWYRAQPVPPASL